MPVPPPLSDPIIEALRALNDWLRSRQIPHTLIGGVAVSLVAEPRITKDIDAIVWLDYENWPEFLASGASFGFVPRMVDALDFAQLRRFDRIRYWVGEFAAALEMPEMLESLEKLLQQRKQ